MSAITARVSRNAPSLRTRYISLTVLVGLVIIAIVAFFYRDVITTKHAVSAAFVDSNQERNEIDNLRTNMLKLYRNIDLFLLDPTREETTENINFLINDSILSVLRLSNSDHPYHVDLNDKTLGLESDLVRLKEQIHYLIEVRMDVNRQYPGMALSAEGMSPPQQAVRSGLSILIEEIETGELELVSNEIYPLLLKTYTLWVDEIAQIRIYLANRFASFSTEILIDQANSLDDFHQKFKANLQIIEQLYQNEDSFQAPSVIESIKKSSAEWYDLLLQVREITESGMWRGDTHVLQTRIIPLSDKITTTIQGIDNLIRFEQNSISDRQRISNETLGNLVIAIVVLFLLFIGAMLISIEWMLFKPIKNVALALRSKAFDIDLPQLEGVKTREVGSLIEAFQEMDDEVTQRQSALEHQALHDHLTGLPNRFMLNQRIEYQLLSAERSEQSFTLFLMDLDHFKDINDTLGHAAGDILLIGVSQRISGLVRKSDTVARLGGDEFAILLPDTDKQASLQLAQSVSSSIAQPFLINDHKVNIGVSIGIVTYPGDGDDAMSLLQHADMAMYVAKRKRIGFAHYEVNEDFYSTERLALMNDLQHELENNKLELYYQPKIDADGESIIGAEALLRWNHKKFGFIPPDKVVELAEHIGIIHQLSIWVLNQAIQQCSQWHQQGNKISISVNLSVRDLSNEDLCKEIAAMLENNQLESKYLTLEITESVMMENLALSIELLNRLSGMGISISIDDFGTGFSSLAYLKRLPVNELKIDKSFIMDMDTDQSDEVIVQSTINLGHNLGLNVVAEGIESRNVMNMVKELGCDHVQGYFFSKPKTSKQFNELLQR